jgi:DNA-binding MarR family transcriptional regulator
MVEEIESGLVLDIISLHSKIQKRIGSALSVHGIGVTEYLVLNQLYATPAHKMRRTDLADRVGLSPSGITRLINPMEKIGLVEKEANPRDARVSLVTLSATGKKTCEEARVSFLHASTTLFEHFDVKQLGVLSDLLKIVS